MLRFILNFFSFEHFKLLFLSVECWGSESLSIPRGDLLTVCWFSPLKSFTDSESNSKNFRPPRTESLEFSSAIKMLFIKFPFTSFSCAKFKYEHLIPVKYSSRNALIS